jgi:hypothetical protein
MTDVCGGQVGCCVRSTAVVLLKEVRLPSVFGEKKRKKARELPGARRSGRGEESLLFTTRAAVRMSAWLIGQLEQPRRRMLCSWYSSSQGGEKAMPTTGTE